MSSTCSELLFPKRLINLLKLTFSNETETERRNSFFGTIFQSQIAIMPWLLVHWRLRKRFDFTFWINYSLISEGERRKENISTFGPFKRFNGYLIAFSKRANTIVIKLSNVKILIFFSFVIFHIFTWWGKAFVSSNTRWCGKSHLTLLINSTNCQVLATTTK